MNRLEQYEQECKERLIKNGFPDTITGKQALLIVEPSDAPENFYRDGQLSFTLAKRIWKMNLKLAKLDDSLIKKADKFNFG